MNAAELTTEGLFADSPHTMVTISGQRIDPFNPDPDAINVADIARALARICRFNGHALDPVGHSVAAHSIRVAEHCAFHTSDPAIALQGLFHDAAEAYLGDIIRPLKKRPEFAFFHDVEAHLTKVIFERFGLGAPMHPFVHEADNRMLLLELELRDSHEVFAGVDHDGMANRFVAKARRWAREAGNWEIT